MTYIVRYTRKARKGGLNEHFHTMEPEALTVKYKERHRRTGEKVMGMVVVENAGLDKSTVLLNSRSETTLSGRGRKYGLAWLPVRLLDRHKSIRVLRDDDLAAFAVFDARIAEKEAELKAILNERQAAVSEAWKRAEKIGISELEELADGS